jgi:hypothetical protein
VGVWFISVFGVIVCGSPLQVLGVLLFLGGLLQLLLCSSSFVVIPRIKLLVKKLKATQKEQLSLLFFHCCIYRGEGITLDDHTPTAAGVSSGPFQCHAFAWGMVGLWLPLCMGGRAPCWVCVLCLQLQVCIHGCVVSPWLHGSVGLGGWTS